MKVLNTISKISNSIVKKYRNSQLEKGTSDLEREIYVNRYGSIKDSQKKYGTEFNRMMQNGIMLREGIMPDTWVPTKFGLEMTKLKCRKSTFAEKIQDLTLAVFLPKRNWEAITGKKESRIKIISEVFKNSFLKG